MVNLRAMSQASLLAFDVDAWCKRALKIGSQHSDSDGD